MQIRSQNAVDMVTSTIAKLQSINEEGRKTIGEIEKYISDLDAIKTGMQDRLARNETICARFAELIGETE